MSLADWWNRTRWRLSAPVYDRVARSLDRGRQRAIERLDPRPDDRLLIPGCGTGVDLEYLPADASITAVDVTPAMVRRTEARADALDVEVDARVGDARSLPFDDDSFDAVLLHLVLSVVPDPDAVVAETARVLAPDGRVSIFDEAVPEGADSSLPRRAIDPGTGLEIERRGILLGDRYTVTIARGPASDAAGEAAGPTR